MKKFYFFMIVFLWTFSVHSQSVLHYNFALSLSEVNGNGPDLTPLGNMGIYVEDTLGEVGSAVKQVYRFEENSGLQFDNLAAGRFLDGNYTLEIYFVFDELNSWKRVVDWKNRKTDYGAYVYNGELNFYPYVYSNESPVAAGEYTYYVVTRNMDDEKLIIYTDARTQISLFDSPNDAILDNDQVLNFFHDDFVVPNEASPGAVAMIKLYNYVLDSTAIQENFDDLRGNLFSVGEHAKINTSMSCFPNPTSDQLVVDMSHFDDHEMVKLNLINMLGHTVLDLEAKPAQQASVQMMTSDLESGIYMLVAESETKQARVKVLIQH